MRAHLTKLLLVSAIVSSMLLSCKKNDVQNQLPSTLTLKSYMPKGDFRVFSHGGEVFDPALIASFIRTSGMQQVQYSFGPRQNTVNDLTFLNDTAFRIGEHEYYNYAKISGGYFFQKINYPSDNAFHHLTSLITPFFKYPEMLLNQSGSYSYRKRFAGYGNLSNLSIPGIDLCIVTRNAGTGDVIDHYGSFGNWNEFNSEGLKALGQRDTIIIRETISNFGTK